MYNETITPLTIRQLLSDGRYRIPIYQRNYDWGERETLQLIEDIADYASQTTLSKYYVGSLVVFTRHNVGEDYYETIDGQQRLTTLTILLCVLKNLNDGKDLVSWFNHANLSYDHRSEADDTISLLAEGKISNYSSSASLIDVYKIIQKNLLNKLVDKKISLQQFVTYLLEKVVIMRIPVPQDTDLNHYFEIMNSRGEQLEKHEVLKAILMSHLENDRDAICLFNDIWEACSDMTTYVPMKFRPNLRTQLFSSNWNVLQYNEYDQILCAYKSINDDEEDVDDPYISRSLADLLEDAKNNRPYPLPDFDKDSDGQNDRFGSIVNFQNFLLHVLKVMYNFDKTEYNKEIDDCIRLDDKRLIDIFQLVLKSRKDRGGFVKKYLMSLLTMRILFDYYVIKRENYEGRDGWSLKMPKKYDSRVNYVGTFSQDEEEDGTSKEIRMLEAMFHVSAPTQVYKHWLNALMYYLYTKYMQNGNRYIDATNMRDYLYQLACTFMLDRYLTNDKIDFEDIIYRNNCMPHNNEIEWDLIDNGCGVENFVFNFYDFITWKQNPSYSKYRKFEFSYRTSVEHFYPQTPQKGHEQLTKDTGLDSFGNLCLISRGMNSKFSNNMPNAKVDNFGREEAVQELSIKLIEMMDVVRETNMWSTPEINQFEEMARKRIKEALGVR